MGTNFPTLMFYLNILNEITPTRIEIFFISPTIALRHKVHVDAKQRFRFPECSISTIFCIAISSIPSWALLSAVAKSKFIL